MYSLSFEGLGYTAIFLDISENCLVFNAQVPKVYVYPISPSECPEEPVLPAMYDFT